MFVFGDRRFAYVGAALAFLVLAVAVVEAAPEEERVAYLPNVATFDEKFGLYSGYVDLPAHGASSRRRASLHYIFVESARNPRDDPLLLWFNGGPGCSSLIGFAQEHGPYTIADGTSTWRRNPWSWNNESNVLYVESPAGVGFSWCSEETTEHREERPVVVLDGEGEVAGTSKTKKCAFDDETSTDDNLNFVLGWLDKFPEYWDHDLYLSGESYAGVYVPLLAHRIAEYNDEQHAANGDDTRDVFKRHINMKGFMVGNGVTNHTLGGLSASLELYYYHGMIDTKLYYDLRAEGCVNDVFLLLGGLGGADADDLSAMSETCQRLLDEFHKAKGGINIYDIDGICYRDHDPYHPSSAAFATRSRRSLVNSIEGISTTTTAAAETRGRKYKRGATQYEYTPWMDPGGDNLRNLDGNAPCIFGTPVSDYLNRDDVRSLLHIPSHVQAWEMCTDDIEYTPGPRQSQWAYEALHRRGGGDIRMLHYSGDNDAAVATVGTRAWIDAIGWNVTERWRAVRRRRTGGRVRRGEGRWVLHLRDGPRCGTHWPPSGNRLNRTVWCSTGCSGEGRKS